MKMKGQLDSPSPMKKHKSKKASVKKKKQAKLEAKKQPKDKKVIKAQEAKPTLVLESKTPAQKAPVKKASESLNPAPSKQEPVKVAVSITPDALTNAAIATTPTAPNTPRSRVSKSLEPMSKEEQLVAINQIIKRLLLDEITQGTALRELRVNVLGLRQEAYTELTGVSRKTLSEIENDKGNYTPEIINKVFKPFELKTSLVPTSSQLLIAILSS